MAKVPDWLKLPLNLNPSNNGFPVSYIMPSTNDFEMVPIILPVICRPSRALPVPETTPDPNIVSEPSITPVPFIVPFNCNSAELAVPLKLLIEPDSKSFKTPVIISSTFFDSSLFSYP